jgi:hypothetical protein
LDYALRHLVRGVVERRKGLRKKALGLGDDLLGWCNGVLCIRQCLFSWSRRAMAAANSRRAGVGPTFATSLRRSRAIMIRTC